MKCKEFESMIHELVSGRVGDTAKQLEALGHAGICLGCARRLDEENKLTERLRAFAGSLSSQLAPLRVEAELLQAFRERNVRERVPLLGKAWTGFWHRLSWCLAFAALAAAAWIVIVQWPRLHRSTGAAPSRVATSRPEVSPDALRAKVTPGASETGAAPKSAVKTQLAHIRHSQQSVPEELAIDATTDFISLGTCDDSQCMEEATLVRVALPAEALLAFGLGMDNEFAPDALVQADVALGSNGVPFAIRFVN
jgi:hypothetical protein